MWDACTRSTHPALQLCLSACTNQLARPTRVSGYLPGSDKATTTQEGSTLAAVQAACKVLRPGGLCSILCYTGHPGGRGGVGQAGSATSGGGAVWQPPAGAC